MKKIRKRILILCAIVFVLSAIAVWIVWGNTTVEITEYEMKDIDIPKAFSGFKIAQISDFHDAEIGKDNEKLIAALKSVSPDIIVITGDLIDSRRTDVEHSLSFVKELVKLAPCYYVTGNHEGRVSEYSDLKAGLLELGVKVLENEAIELKKNGETITLIGVHDQNFEVDESVVERGETYTVLLAHRPMTFDLAVEKEIDLLLCGHNHGGQFRIPFVGGVFVPNQGFFPKYDAGLYIEGETSMIISRGIGNSAFPFRVNNRPEIVLVELISGEE